MRCAEGEVSGCMRWADVEHWLWPIFSTASCSWRQVTMHTAVWFPSNVSTPGLAGCSGLPDALWTPKLMLSRECGEGTRWWWSAEHKCSAVMQERLGLGLPFSGKDLAPPPRLLYLLSPCLTQELPYWPGSVQVWPASLDILCAIVTCSRPVHEPAHGAAVYAACGMAGTMRTSALQACCISCT